MEQAKPHFEVPIELARQGLQHKIAMQEELMKTSITADEAGHSEHFDLRNLYMEALEYFEVAVVEVQGNQQQLHDFIQSKIENCVEAIAAHNAPDEQANLQGAAEDYRLRWCEEQKKLKHELKVWEVVREEAFPEG